MEFCNLKTLCDKLVRYKIRENDEEERENFPCGHRNCEICKILEPGKELKSTVTGQVFKMNFHCVVYLLSLCGVSTTFHLKMNFHCVVYLLSCRICELVEKGSENSLDIINPI